MSTKLSVVLLIAGAVVIAIGVWMLMHTPAEAPTADDTMAITEHDDTTADTMTETTDDEEPIGDPVFHALVSYTDDGFEPAVTTIAQGETVRFVNNSSRGLWVGGDDHPTHTRYPETSDDDCLGTSFDTCRPLQAAEFWEFTFTHAGEWGFHNHVRASHTGSIIVE